MVDQTRWGCFNPFLDDKDVRIVGVEAGGKGVNDDMEHCASLTGGKPGVLHGNRTYLLQDGAGQILEGYSISAGLDYPGIGPEHSWLHDTGRAEYVSVTDDEALEAFQYSCPHGGDYSCVRAIPRVGTCAQIGPNAARGSYSGDEHVWARGQRYLYRGAALGLGYGQRVIGCRPAITAGRA